MGFSVGHNMVTELALVAERRAVTMCGKLLKSMVARDGGEPPTPAFSGSLNNLTDSRWPPKFLRSRERHANRGLKSWVQKQAQKAPQPQQNSAVSPSRTLEMRMFPKHREDKG